MLNPKQLKISGEVYNTLDMFCQKHGFIRKVIVEKAIIKHLQSLHEKLKK